MRSDTPRLIGCTSATASHLAGATVVARSWRALHPDGEFYILIADEDAQPTPAEEPFVLTPEQIGLDRAELAVRRAIYSAFEYVTSLKPHLLRFLLARTAGAVVFTDSDADVYENLDDVGDMATASGLCLTAHVLEPLPRDGRSPTELELLELGVFNTGLMGVGPAAEPFLEWWIERLRRDCLDYSTGGFFVEQRWVDLVPTYFDHVLLRDPTLNVAFWNIHERSMQSGAGGFTIDGAPLRHFHFSGFDPANPQRLTKHELTFPHRVYLTDQPSVAQLCADYAQRLLAAGHAERMYLGYRYGKSASGRPLGAWERLVYREAVLAAEADGRPAPPDPFDPDQVEAFEDFLDGAPDSCALSTRARARVQRARELLGASEWGTPDGAPRWDTRAQRLLRRAYRRFASRVGRDGGAGHLVLTSDCVKAEYVVG